MEFYHINIIQTGLFDEGNDDNYRSTFRHFFFRFDEVPFSFILAVGTANAGKNENKDKIISDDFSIKCNIHFG